MLRSLVALFTGAGCTTQLPRDDVPVQQTKDRHGYTIPDTRRTSITEAEQQALSAAEEKILAAWDKVQSGSATLIQETLRPTAPGEAKDPADLRLGVHKTGPLDFLKKDGKVLTRTQLTTLSYSGHGPNVLRSPGEFTRTFISDGEFQFVVWEIDGQTRVMKTVAPRSFQYDGKDLRDQRRDGSFLLWLAGDEEIDGRSAYVISSKASDRTCQAGALVRYWFDKKTGINVRSAWYAPEGQLAQVISLKDLKVNIDFPEGHFTYVAPEGVEVSDVTQDRRRAMPIPPPIKPSHPRDSD